MFTAPQPIFEVKAPVRSAWDIPIAPREPEKPEWHGDIALKRAFGVRLGKGDKPLDAALLVFDNKMPDALWAVQNILRDPIVVDAREAVENEINLLDKDQLLAKLLRFEGEKSPQGLPIHESKERLNALKLYAEIRGYLNKINIDASTINNNDNRMEIVLVKAPDQKTEEKVIEHIEVDEVYDLGVSLKLVSNSS